MEAARMQGLSILNTVLRCPVRLTSWSWYVRLSLLFARI